MIRRLWLLGILLGFSAQASEIVSKIRDSQKTLQSAEQQQKQMNLQLARIAASIKTAEKENLQLEQTLDRLQKEKNSSQARYRKAKEKIADLQKQIAALDERLRRRNGRFLNLLSRQFSSLAAIEQMHEKNEESVILQEAYRTYKRLNDRELDRLKQSIDASRRLKAKLSAQRDLLSRSIAGIERKHRLYRQKKREKEALLKKLAREESEYRKKLKELITRQNLLRLTLAKLNILRKEEIAEARRRQAERQAELKRKAQELAELRAAKARERAQAREEGRAVDYSRIKLPPEEVKSVKQYGSSYHRDRIYPYRGPKTISPLPGGRLVKKFGTYVDPIYKIKIFNESITLRAPKTDARVRNVLNGKVVFVGQNSMLGKVVVVAHPGHMHTVYAGLSKISPLIRTGSRVRRGAILGKVRRKLIFEATKETKYINPLRLIRL